MEFLLALTIDSQVMGGSLAKHKSMLINSLFEEINSFIQKQSYGDDINEFLISLYVVNPPEGFEHLYKDFKPKFTEFKLLNNKFKNEKLKIEKQFHYSIKIDGALFHKFVVASDLESEKILAQEVLKSLSNVDKLPKKVKDFDKEQFKLNLEHFFREQGLVS